MQLLKTLNCLNLPDLSGKSTEIMNAIGLFVKNLKNLLFSKNVVIG